MNTPGLIPNADADISAAQIVEEQYLASSTIYRSQNANEILLALLQFARIPFRRASLSLLQSVDQEGIPTLGLEGEISPDWTLQEITAAENTTETPTSVNITRRLASYPAYDVLSALEILQVEDIDRDPFLTDEERARLREAGIAGLILVPLVAGQRLIGLVEIEQVQAAPLPPLRMRAMRRLADQCAVVFQNRSLLESAQGRTNQLALQVRVLEIVNRIASQIAIFTDAQALFDYAAGAMREAMNIDHVGILILEPGPDYGLVISDNPVQMPPGTRLDMDNNPLMDAINQDISKPYVIPNIDTDTRVLPDTRAAFQQLGIRSIMLTPVIIDGRMVASVGFDSYQETRRFSEQDGQLAVTMGAQLAIGLQNIRLVQAQRERQAELAQRVQSLESLNQLATQIGHLRDETSLLDFATAAMSRTMNIDHCTVLVIEPGGQMGRLISEYPDGGMRGIQIPLNETLLEAVYKDVGNPIVANDISQFPLFTEETKQSLHDLGVHAITFAPMLINDQLYATVGFDIYEEGRVFTPDMVQVAQTMVAQLSVAIENIHLLQATEQRAQEANRRATYESLINTVTEQMQRSQDVSVMVDSAVETLGRALGARQARVRFLTTEDNPSFDPPSQSHEETPDARMAR